MEKFLTGLKITLTLIILIAVSAFVVIFNASGKAEREYQNTLKDIASGDWQEAFSLVQEVPNYKDASQLYTYIYPHTFFYDSYKTNADAISGYQRGITLAEAAKPQMKGKNASQYTADFGDLEKVLNFKIAELNAMEQNKAVAQTLNDSIALIKKADYSNALAKLGTIGDNSQYGPEKMQLTNYISLLNAVKAKDQKSIMQIIPMLDPNYKGDLASEIQTSVQAYVNTNNWNTMYNNYIQKQTQNQQPTQSQGQNPSQIQQVQNTNITVGMKKDAVIQALGNPGKDDVISNRYGNYEQMTYTNKVIFFENNTVTVVKS